MLPSLLGDILGEKRDHRPLHYHTPNRASSWNEVFGRHRRFGRLKRRISLRRELSLSRPLLPDSSAVRSPRVRGEDGLRCRLFHRLQPAARLRLPFDGLLKPLIFLTNWSEAARISS